MNDPARSVCATALLAFTLLRVSEKAGFYLILSY
jgi:hypothetical protein